MSIICFTKYFPFHATIGCSIFILFITLISHWKPWLIIYWKFPFTSNLKTLVTKTYHYYCFVYICTFLLSLALFHLAEFIRLTNETFAKRCFPLTRGYLRSLNIKTEDLVHDDPFKKESISKAKLRRVKERGLKAERCATEERHYCSICKRKHYKYMRNKVRHEKYECVNGPQFGCLKCGKKYSQKKSLSLHVKRKHP